MFYLETTPGDRGKDSVFIFVVTTPLNGNMQFAKNTLCPQIMGESLTNLLVHPTRRRNKPVLDAADQAEAAKQRQLLKQRIQKDLTMAQKRAAAETDPATTGRSTRNTKPRKDNNKKQKASAKASADSPKASADSPPSREEVLQMLEEERQESAEAEKNARVHTDELMKDCEELDKLKNTWQLAAKDLNEFAKVLGVDNGLRKERKVLLAEARALKRKWQGNTKKPKLDLQNMDPADKKVIWEITKSHVVRNHKFVSEKGHDHVLKDCWKCLTAELNEAKTVEDFIKHHDYRWLVPHVISQHRNYMQQRLLTKGVRRKF